MSDAYSLLSEFKDYLLSEKGVSANTIDAYNQDLKAFFLWMDAKSKILSKITHRDISDFLMEYKKRGKGHATSSISRMLATLKIFFRYMLSEGHLKKDPAYLIQFPKGWNRLPDVLTVEEIKKLLEIPSKKGSGIRNRTILELLYASGLRVSEVIKLKVNQVDLQVGYLRTMGKGSKERIVPISPVTIERIKRYLKEVRPKLLKAKDCEFLFLTRLGKEFTRQGLWKLIKACARSSGLSKEIHPHTFRHTFATHLLQGGADLRSVQEMLGHASISTTQIYTHLDKSYLQKIHRQFHPRG